MLSTYLHWTSFITSTTVVTISIHHNIHYLLIIHPIRPICKTVPPSNIMLLLIKLLYKSLLIFYFLFSIFFSYFLFFNFYIGSSAILPKRICNFVSHNYSWFTLFLCGGQVSESNRYYLCVLSINYLSKLLRIILLSL